MTKHNNLKNLTPQELRKMIASNDFNGQTSGLANGYAQANLVILPNIYASDFEKFCILNPAPCPLLEIVRGKFSKKLAKNANIYNEIPKYFIYKNGCKVDEKCDVSEFYSDEMTGFLLGCSFSFEEELLRAGLDVRHISLGRNVAMYKTNIALQSAGVFGGNMVVSMRPFSPENARKAAEITQRFPKVHGGPIHFGEAKDIGIYDLNKPDFGDKSQIKQGEIPVFWACGVTSQNAIINAKLPLAITHAPGCMFISDVKNIDLMGW